MLSPLSAERAECAVYIGRFSPLHLGHCRVIDTMLAEFGSDRSLLLLGSCNEALSQTLCFDFLTRLSWIKTLYPDLLVSAIPDYGNDKWWLKQLETILDVWFSEPSKLEKSSLSRVVFYGGAQNDIDFFIKSNLQTRICNRNDGSGPILSATQIRQRLEQQQSISGLVPQAIESSIVREFDLFKTSI
jgi:nicotinic acid mononucleotide adenylyltransferase